ncbi:MAG: beta-N-acetylhexosaminidase [Flaviaesturariibacter sp.]|nr:beta-N-acetylhexosaminidase [Flaviaesturariibacter sp.]
MKKALLFFSLLSGHLFAQKPATVVNIIPQPVSVATKPGAFTLSRQTVLAATDAEDRKIAGLLNEYLQVNYGFKLDIDNQEGKDYIRFSTRKFITVPAKETYNLNVSMKGVTIEGDSYAATFYGMQSLIQLLPVERPRTPTPKLQIPNISVTDYPRFAYRGMHLDVCRHFFPVAFLKKYIDYLALHKMNTFHWHLTDDQGWRIEIKKYPALNTVGAYRNGTIIGRYPGTGNDNIRYGGYYTHEEVKEVVRYAAARYITVLPEIEMPGHASAAIAAYPWLSCFPEQETLIPSHPSLLSQGTRGKKVQETWGVFEDVFCAGKDSTFTFLQDVLDEVLPLFPSTFIHIGGDESPKTHWKRCPRCQARMKAEGLKDEHQLQSYFVQRMEKYLNAKGRTIIGWDEILEGGLAPNAVVMSWQGEGGGIAAAKQAHTVIMTPQKPVYFDHSQTKNEDSLVIGGYNPLEAVYAYEPVPKELDTAAARYILGAQANLWTEYIPTPSKVEYMIFPRLSALSEVLWSPKESRNWSSFERRLPVQMQRYELWKASFSEAYYDLKTAVLPEPNGAGVIWNVTSKRTCEYCHVKVLYESIANKDFFIFDTSEIRDPKDIVRVAGYKIDSILKKAGERVSYFEEGRNEVNILINGSGVASATQYFHHTRGKPILLPFSFNKATGKKVSITATPNSKYPGQGGAFSLVNGIYSNKGLSYPDWLGFIGDDLEATIDLGKAESFSSVKMHTLDQNGSWVYLPAFVEVLTSNDGKRFKPVGRSSEFAKDTLTMGFITVRFAKQSARYIKVVAKNYGTIPDGMPGGGNKAWLFADELIVE